MTFVPTLALTELRQAQNLTQQDVAEEIGVTRESLGNWERGTHHPRYGDVLKWADFLGFPLTVLNSLQEVEDID